MLSGETAVDSLGFKRKNLINAHRIDESIGADCSRRARAEDPIPDLSHSTGDRLADRQSAGTEEWIRGEARVVADDAGEKSHSVSQLPFATLRLRSQGAIRP